jgi:hypothetical protein
VSEVIGASPFEEFDLRDGLRISDRETGHLGLYLNNTGYQEIPQVPLQGRTIIAGTEFNWPSIRH